MGGLKLMLSPQSRSRSPLLFFFCLAGDELSHLASRLKFSGIFRFQLSTLAQSLKIETRRGKRSSRPESYLSLHFSLLEYEIRSFLPPAF